MRVNSAPFPGYVRLELPQRPRMDSPQYIEAVHEAALVFDAAKPWLLVPYDMRELWVARSRSAPMLLVTWLVNLWRRPRRWWLGRLKLAQEARFYARRKSGGD